MEIKEKFTRVRFLPGLPTKEIRVETTIKGQNGQPDRDVSGKVIVPNLRVIPRDRWDEIIGYIENLNELVVKQMDADAANWLRPQLRVTDATRETRALTDELKELEKAAQLTPELLTQMRALLAEDEARRAKEVKEKGKELLSQTVKVARKVNA